MRSSSHSNNGNGLRVECIVLMLTAHKLLSCPTPYTSNRVEGYSHWCGDAMTCESTWVDTRCRIANNCNCVHIAEHRSHAHFTLWFLRVRGRNPIDTCSTHTKHTMVTYRLPHTHSHKLHDFYIFGGHKLISRFHYKHIYLVMHICNAFLLRILMKRTNDEWGARAKGTTNYLLFLIMLDSMENCALWRCPMPPINDSCFIHFAPHNVPWSFWCALAHMRLALFKLTI